MILLIDNYDSFTYNLVHYLAELGAKVRVVRNDAITAREIEMMSPKGIVISPGPGTPNDGGVSLSIFQSISIPTLGVCLGHQCLGQAFGGTVMRAGIPLHGKVSEIVHDGKGIFKGIPSPFQVTRYHSLIVTEENLPDCLTVTARATKSDPTPNVIMGLQHKTLPFYGVQFHPESIASEHGHAILRNFLESL